MFGLIGKKKAKRIANEAELKGIERGVTLGYQVHKAIEATAGKPGAVVYMTGRPLDKDIQNDIEEICRKEGL